MPSYVPASSDAVPGGGPQGAAERFPLAPIPHRRAFATAFGLLVAAAWLALWLWERSPYGRFLHHGELGGIAHGDVASALSQAAMYVTGWLLMTVAMMLPTTLPLLDAFRRLTAHRPDHGRLLALVVAGYVGVWLAFGVAAHLFDFGLHALFERVAWLQAHPWVFGAAALLVAGAFQFSPLKYRCLDRCRAPVGFVFEHWRGGDPGGQSLALGAHHGLFCVGCCWALMLLMFAVGTGNPAWMLGLAAVMAIEKNVAWGRRLALPLGLALLAWGGGVVLQHLPLAP